jgi:hypothetical protein
MMKTWSRALGISLLVLTAIVTLLMAAAWSTLPLDHTSITLHGETFSLADLSGSSAVLFFVLAVAGVVLAVVAGLAAAIVGLSIGALGVALGLVVTVASLALVASPFALILWLLWRALRPRPAPAVVAGP